MDLKSVWKRRKQRKRLKLRKQRSSSRRGKEIFMPITQDLFTITPSPRLRTITKINAVPRIRDRIRTAGYARVSTAADNQEGSLSWQKTHLEQIICSNPDYEYAGMYEDDGISGTVAETRPGLQ